jgi:hypothetical protein
MNLKRFQDLCRDEWNNRKGDVRTMWLVEDSYRQLNEDALAYRQTDKMDIYLDEDAAQNKVAGAQVSVLVNPYTRTVVKMRLARDTDVAEVWYGDGHFETRFLDPEKATELGIQVPA